MHELLRPTVTLQALIQSYLTSVRQRGIHRLAVDEEARALLRTWMLAARQGKRQQPSATGYQPGTASNQPGTAEPPGAIAPTAGITPPHPPSPHTTEASAPTPGTSSILRASILDTPPDTPTEPAQEDIPFFRVPGQTPAELWQQMERLLPAWKPLQELGTLRNTAVMGTGNRQASIMFLGDAPGYYDELAAKPFQGEAGKKLDGMLTAMGLTREQVYITHLVKFRPSQPRQTTNTRTPTAREILFSRSIVDLEIKLVQPRVIVALGVVAARGLLQRGELPLAEYQAHPGNYAGIPVVVSHHPSYLLRTSDLKERRRLWEEMLHAMQLAGLPISDKQRHYFLPKTTGHS